MKKILVFLVSLISLKSFGQFPVNQFLGSDSTLVTSRGGMKSRFINKPFSDTTQANLQRVKFYDGSQIYTNSAGGQLWLRDSTLNKWVLVGAGSPNTSLGTGYKIAVDGTNNVKSIRFYNGLTGDSATSGEVGGRLGGTLNQNTTIDSGGFFLNFNLSRLGITNSAPNAKIDLLTNSIGITQQDNYGIVLRNAIAATTGLNQTSPPFVFAGTGFRSVGSVSYIAKMMTDVVGVKSNSGNQVLMQFKSSVDNSAYDLVATIRGIPGAPLSAPSANAGNNAGALISAGTFNDAALWRGLTSSNMAFGDPNNLSSPSLTGTANRVFGQGLTALTSGINNTVVGSGMNSATTASMNTSVGYQALAALTTGTQNTAVGMNALLANTTGQKNTAFGAAALEENTTGSFNSFNGQDAGLHNSTGIENTGIGYLANSQNRTGGGNIGIGSSSGRGLVNANEVISIGHNSNYLQWSGAAIPEDTIRNSIAIGTHSFNTANNQLMLGSDSIFSAYMYGIAAGAGTHAVRYNPTTKQLFYGDTSASGGGSGVTTMAAIGSTPNANGATISGSTLNLEPASGSFGGVVTTGTQTFAGVKTFSSFPVFSSGTSGRVPFFTTGGAVTDDDGMQFNATSNTFTTTGPAASLTNGPKHEFKLDSDPDPIISWFAYDHDNVQLDFDARFNGSNYTSSHAGSNFAWYKTGNELIAAYNAGTAKGSTFSFNFTGGLRLSNTGLVGIGTAPSEKLDVAGNVRFSGALMPNNAAGTSGQILASAGAGSPPTWVTPTTLSSGTFTPTATGGANYASSASLVGKYSRVGAIVTATLSGTVTATAGGSSVIFDLSLPIASNFTTVTDAIGNGAATFAGSNENIFVLANTTDDRLQLSVSTIGSTSARSFCITVQYEIK